MMAPLVLAALLAAEAPAAAPEDIRAIVATITDAKGAALGGLAAGDVAVMENGVVRELVSIDPDDRPITLAFILDTSGATGSSLRLSLVDAVGNFLRNLPDKTSFALWTTNDRPVKVADYSTDPADAQRALGRLFPNGGNTLFDAIVEASADLKKKEGERRVVVVLTGVTPELSHRDRFVAVEQAEKNADLFLSVAFETGEGGEDHESYDYTLGTLANRTGGRYDILLSSMGAAPALNKLLAEIKGQYRLTYVSGPDQKNKDRKLEVKVARPGVRVRLGRSKSS